MSKLTATGIPRELKGLKLWLKYVNYEDYDEEPTLFIARTSGTFRKAIGIPQYTAFEFADDNTIAQRVLGYANFLWPMGADHSDIMRLASVIQEHLPDLIFCKPKAEITQKEIEKMMENDGLKITMGGKVLVDAS